MFDVYKLLQYVIMYVSEKRLLDEIMINMFLENSILNI